MRVITLNNLAAPDGLTLAVLGPSKSDRENMRMDTLTLTDTAY